MGDLIGENARLAPEDAGTYVFVVEETAGGGTGYTNDAEPVTVTVDVAYDEATGVLSATVVAEKGGVEVGRAEVSSADADASAQTVTVPFVNTYAASTDVDGGTSAHVSTTKTLTGRPLEAGEFEFTLRYAGKDDVLKKVANAADGTVDFGSLSYTTDSIAQAVRDGDAHRVADVDGKPAWEFAYTAEEVVTDKMAAAGITAAKRSFGFTVTVVDSGDGTLAAAASLPEDHGFANVYSAAGEDGDPISMTPAGTKLLEAAEGLVPDSIEGAFTFTLEALNGGPLPAETVAANDAQGNVAFGPIEFTLDDLNRALGAGGGAGEVGAAVGQGDAAADQVAAADGQGADAERAADGVAGADGGAGSKAGGSAGDAAADEATGSVEDAGEVADGAAARVGESRSYTFRYRVTESGAAPGVTNDAQATREFSYTVTDDGEGHLTVTADPAQGPLFTFTNTYSVEPVASSVTDQLAVSKVLEGRDMAADEFAFEMVDAAGEVVSTVTNGAAGQGEPATLAFDPVTFTEPGDYAYTLREVIPDDGDKRGGVTYDATTFAVTAHVADRGDGTLGVTWESEANDLTFTNVYEVAETTLALGASKVLTGRDLADGEFAFRLTYETADGEKTVEATNDADGRVVFPTVSFDAAGTYVLRVSEVLPDDDDPDTEGVQKDGVTYDETVYEQKVVVTDDGSGQLEAVIDGEPAVFTNSYVEPEEPVDPLPEDPGEPEEPEEPGEPEEPADESEPEEPADDGLPSTGDAVSLTVLAAFAAAGLGAVGCGAYLTRRKRG